MPSRSREELARLARHQGPESSPGLRMASAGGGEAYGLGWHGARVYGEARGASTMPWTKLVGPHDARGGTRQADMRGRVPSSHGRGGGGVTASSALGLLPHVMAGGGEPPPSCGVAVVGGCDARVGGSMRGREMASPNRSPKMSSGGVSMACGIAIG